MGFRLNLGFCATTFELRRGRGWSTLALAKKVKAEPLIAAAATDGVAAACSARHARVLVDEQRGWSESEDKHVVGHNHNSRENTEA